MIEALRGAVATARQEIGPSRAQHYEAGLDGDRYTVAEEGDRFAVAATPELAAEAIAARARRRALELAALKGWVRLRGGLLDLAGKRILLVGPPGSGKTVLLLRVAGRGGAPQGDESVLLRDGLALAVKNAAQSTSYLTVNTSTGEVNLPAVPTGTPTMCGRTTCLRW